MGLLPPSPLNKVWSFLFFQSFSQFAFFESLNVWEHADHVIYKNMLDASFTLWDTSWAGLRTEQTRHSGVWQRHRTTLGWGKNIYWERGTLHILSWWGKQFGWGHRTILKEHMHHLIWWKSDQVKLRFRSLQLTRRVDGWVGGWVARYCRK